MKEILDFLINIIFPINCVKCKRGGFYLCPKCLSYVPNAEPIKEDWIISVWSYKDEYMKKILWLLKFQGKFSVVKDIRAGLYDYLHDELIETEIFKALKNPILVPIPISNKKLRTRGYNQSLVIAKHLAKESGGRLKVNENVLEKIIDKRAQNSIRNKKERFENIKGAFKVKNYSLVKDKFIILVDDITTTHATLIEAKKILEKAGAKNILAVTIAH